MADSIFEDLPPPSAPQPSSKTTATAAKESTQPPPPPPAIKSALKRPKPSSEPQLEVSAPKKSLRFKTTTDASEAQVIEAMHKIASHIKNPSKFSKASKLAVQLIQSGSVKPASADHFFAILEASMSLPTTCNESSFRADYHALFSAAQDTVEFLNMKQRNLLDVWAIRSVLANDLFTDDSFVFSKATGKIKEVISNLPVATDDEDAEEAAPLKNRMEVENADGQTNTETSVDAASEGTKLEEPDPFGLDALISSKSKKDDKGKATAKTENKEEGETKKFLKSRREALISCLEIAAKRYKTPWCQTAIDILVRHASDNISRFTQHQRDAIQKLWASVHDQQIRRKQGKSVTGKLDVNAFEYLQQKYASEKISIRHAVGGSGDRHCEQWLG